MNADPDDIFLRARELPDPVERAAFLRQACGDDATMREELERLLEEEPGADAFFSRPASPTLLIHPAEKPGDLVSRYKLLQQIGEGGFGSVWMAEQVEPVKRRVALKIIKLGMDTREVIARFEAERQALAMMDHPHIARVFDAGATDKGRPFFVMELVKGIPINRFCDECRLGTRERLLLFADVCSAISHAHQKGVIHRDIKPSNVLVTLHGDKPVVKIIDFGIAKATHAQLTEKTLFTRFEQFIGTPAYMSPEQTVLSGLDIDTRSDIYSLGVLLYELLTGRPPFDAQTLASAGYEEMRRIIREVEPPKPSLRLSTLAGEERTSVAQTHRTEPENLHRLVESDLDWIVMKALEKDRSRRYETANSLALDIAHFLADEPIFARPPSTSYRLRKYVRRHRLAFATSLAITIALTGGLAATSWMYFKEKSTREQAQAAEARALTAERQAVAAAARSDESRGLLKAILWGDPDSPWFQDAGQLERSLTELVQEAEATPHVARALNNHGLELSKRDNLGAAEVLVAKALDVFRRIYPEGAQEVVPVMNNLGLIRRDLRKFDQAEKLLREASDMGGSLWGADSWQVAKISNDLGTTLREQGRWDEAEQTLQQSLALRKALMSGDRNIQCVETTSELAELSRISGQLATAEERYRDTLDILRAIPKSFERDSAESYVKMHLATTVVAMGGDFQEAESLARECVNYYKSVDPGESMWHTSYARSVLGEVLSAQGKHAEAEPLLLGAHEGIRIPDERVHARHRRDIIQRLITHYESVGQADESARWREALASFEAAVAWKEAGPRSIGEGEQPATK